MRTALMRFQEALKSRQLDGAVIAAPESLSSVNLRYLSGFTGSSAYLVISRDKAWILTDFRYLEQAQMEASDFEVVRHAPQVRETIADICRRHAIHHLGFEADRVPYQMWQGWNDAVPVVWRPLDQMVEGLRVVKSTEEIDLIREAARVAGEALLEVLPALVGKREVDIALDLEMAMRRRGAEALAFPTIVASGERGAMPHAHPTARVIRADELVTIDFGARVEGYNSDETVTVATGRVSRTLRHIFEVVKTAQEAGIAHVKAGARSSDVDAAARRVIADAGYGEAFGHGTGHGVGLEVHEDPYAFHVRSDNAGPILEPGMTITVEPGIYLPGVGGVRLEDTLVITEDGYERLTTIPKHFRVVPDMLG